MAISLQIFIIFIILLIFVFILYSTVKQSYIKAKSQVNNNSGAYIFVLQVMFAALMTAEECAGKRVN